MDIKHLLAQHLQESTDSIAAVIGTTKTKLAEVNMGEIGKIATVAVVSGFVSSGITATYTLQRMQVEVQGIEQVNHQQDHRMDRMEDSLARQLAGMRADLQQVLMLVSSNNARTGRENK